MLPVQTIQDLLPFLPGVGLTRRGARGVQWDLNLRSSTFEQSVVMVNGIRIDNPQTGHHDQERKALFAEIGRLSGPITISIQGQVDNQSGRGTVTTGAVSGRCDFTPTGPSDIVCRNPANHGQPWIFASADVSCLRCGWIWKQITYSTVRSPR